MKKNEMIIGVIEAFDEIERLANENRELRRMAAATLAESGPEDDARPRYYAGIYEYGRSEIWAKYGRGRWYSANVHVTTEDDGTRRAESFDSWFKENFVEFPDFMCRDDFLIEFNHELREKYEKGRDEALKEAE